eukprot:5950239-Amphidinium_carterae.1
MQSGLQIESFKNTNDSKLYNNRRNQETSKTVVLLLPCLFKNSSRSRWRLYLRRSLSLERIFSLTNLEGGSTLGAFHCCARAFALILSQQQKAKRL